MVAPQVAQRRVGGHTVASFGTSANGNIQCM